MDKIDLSLHCPKCNTKKEPCMFLYRGFFRRLEMPLYLCAKCGVCCLDKRLVRQLISQWMESEPSYNKTKERQREIYKKVLRELNNLLLYYQEKQGYKIVPFNKWPM